MATNNWLWNTQDGRGTASLNNAAEPLTLLASGKAVLSIAAEGTLKAAQFQGDGSQLTIDKKPLLEHLEGKLDLKTGGTITGPLQVRGNLATPLPSKVDIRNDNLARVVGRPAAKVAATLQVGVAVKINEKTYTVTAIDPDQSAFTLNQELAGDEPRTNLSVYTDTDLWVVQNGAGEPKLVVDKSGHVRATSFAGAIEARHLRGLAVEHLPDLPASKITDGELSVQRIPNLDAAKITSGTLAPARLPKLPASQISGLEGALDSKLNTSGGTIADALAFGSTRRQMINLYSPGYGIGIQDGTQYFRTDKNFAWYKGGSHTNEELQPGANGIVQMVIKDGNVGIGTNDPGTDKLKVQGNALIDGNLTVSIGKSVRFALQNEGKLSLGPGAFEVDAPNIPGGRFVVTEQGNVGIGTNNPGTDKLKVQGNASIAGNLHVTGTLYMANPLRHRMYPADPIVYHEIFRARDAAIISKLGNPTYDDTTYQRNPWDDGRSIIKYGGNNEQDGNGARVSVPPGGYDTVWVRLLGDRWNVIHAYFVDGPDGQRDLGLWTGGNRSTNCYCPDGSLTDGSFNIAQWLPIPAGHAGALALISKPQTDKEFWLSGVAFSKNPWAHAAQSALGYHWQVNGGDQVPWDTPDWNSDVLAKIPPRTNLCLKVPVVPNKRDKLLYLIEHNSNWNGCMHTAITVNNSPIERFLATYDNPFARHWNSKQYDRYIAAMIPAALIPDGARYLNVRIDMSKQGDADHPINFREIGTHDLEIPEIS
jgi:hypothetical protein